MTGIFIAFSRYFTALLFGTAVAVSFAGMTFTRKNSLAFGSFVTGLFALQIVCLQVWGMPLTMKLYPLLSHVPVVVFIVV
jgi:two-component system sensor histidine kinase AgrC